MLMILLSSCILILLLVALRPFTRKRISPMLQYSLWLLVAIRLLLPFQLWESPLSLENLFPENAVSQEQAPSLQQIPNHSVPQTETPTIADTPVVHPSEFISPEQALPEATLPTANISQNAFKDNVFSTAPPVSQEIGSAAPDVTRPEVSQTFSLSTKQVLIGIWFTGFLVMAAWFLSVNIRFHRAAKRNAKKLDLSNFPLDVYETESVPSPCLTGLFKPQVFLLPQEDPRQQKHILTHEHTHYRHGDHIWSFIRGLCLCVYWFNPLVWVAAYLSKEDCELACDYGAVRTLGEEERLPYGRTLLSALSQANRPGNLLRSATTMGGGKKQLRTRIENIAFRPKRLLWVTIPLILILTLTVGCTFTGGLAPNSQQEESGISDTDPVPSENKESIHVEISGEETTDKVPVDETLSSLPYGNTTVVTDFEADGYTVPKILLDTPYGAELNRRIQNRFGKIAEGDRSQYSSVSYDWYINHLKSDDDLDDNYLLTLEITVTDTKGEEERIYYNVDLSTGMEPTYMNFYSELRYRVAQQLAYELMTRYANTGEVSFSETDFQRFERNLAHANEDGIAWFRKDGNIQASFLYEPLDGSAASKIHIDNLVSGSGPVLSMGTKDVKVVDLYTYGYSGEPSNTIPFLIAPGSRILNTNATILLNYLEPLINEISYTWAVNGDILSFSIRGKDPYTDGYMCLAENFFLNDASDREPTSEEVLSQASPKMTPEEYEERAMIQLQAHFFELFPDISTAPLNQSIIAQAVLRCGSSGNIAESKPYLDQEGNVWTYAYIYQIAGSTKVRYLIPISTGKVNDEYIAFAEEHGIFRESKEALLAYLELLYGEGDYELLYTAENTFPEYVDDNIYCEAPQYRVMVRLSRKIGLKTFTEEEIFAIPEVEAAIRLLNMEERAEIVSLLSPDGEDRNPFIFEGLICDPIFAANDGYTLNRYIKFVYDIAPEEVYILIYYRP